MIDEPIKKYHPMGGSTLLMFIIERSFLLFLLVPLLIVGIIGAAYVPLQYLNLLTNAILIYSLILLFIIVGIIGVGALEYWRYSVFIDEKDVKIARGLISTEEIGVPYRRIKGIAIDRSLVAQILGVSDVIITLLDSSSKESDESEPNVVLPAVPRDIALEIQNIVLKRAQVEQISVIGP